MRDDSAAEQREDVDATASARVFGNARTKQGEQYGVYGETDAGEGYGIYTPGDAGVDGTLDAEAVRTTVLHSESLPYDALVMEDETGTAYAVGRTELIDSGADTASVLENALYYEKKGHVALASDVTIDSQVEIPGSVDFDGTSHTVTWTGTGFALYHHPPADNMGEMIGHYGQVRNLKLDCGPNNGDGILSEDLASTRYTNVEVRDPTVGWLVTDDEYWTEHSVWDNVRVKEYRDAGLRIGSVTFDCRFEHVSLQSTVDGVVGLDLTDDAPSGAEGNDARHTVFDQLMIWHFQAPNPGTTTAIRVDTDANHLTFRKPQVHPIYGGVDLHVTPDATGSLELEDPTVPNLALNEAGIPVVEEPQQRVTPDVGIVEDFGDGRLVHPRQGTKQWDPDAGHPVQYRPSWGKVYKGENVGGAYRIPAGEVGFSTGAFAVDTDWQWSFTFEFESGSPSGEAWFGLFESPTTGENVKFVWRGSGGHRVLKNEGSGWSEITGGQTAVDTDRHTFDVERTAGGTWSLAMDGTAISSGTDPFLPSGACAFKIRNNTDSDVTIHEIRINAP